VSLHELGHDLVLANELGFELLDLLVLDAIDGLVLAAVLEGDMAVFEELLLPAVELADLQAELIAEVGNGDLVDEMAFEDGDLFGAGKVTTRLLVGLLVHGGTSVQVMLTRTDRCSRFD